MRLRIIAVFLLFGPLAGWTFAGTEALLVTVADLHSAYDKVPAFVAEIDQLKRENPQVPLAILIDGDAFEYSNPLSRRTGGAIDFAMFAALAQRAPTILNLGNHEADLLTMAETVGKLRSLGVTVIGGNVRNRETGAPFAPASASLTLGSHAAVVAGCTTNELSTYRAAIRPSLDLSDPVTWAQQNLVRLLGNAPIKIVLSHAGLRADRDILRLVPDGTLFSGAHDHLRFVHEVGRTVYFHSGSWLECITIARLERTTAGLRWAVTQRDLDDTAPRDPAMTALIRDVLAKGLTPAETAVMGHLPKALSPAAAAEFAVAAARHAAGADAAMIGGTTFGAGLPAGDVTRYAFDTCVRFDGPLFGGEINGAQLKELLRRANQGMQTPFADRSGENLVAAGPQAIELDRQYRLVTTDWVAHNAVKYFGPQPPKLAELPGLRLKAAVAAALQQ